MGQEYGGAIPRQALVNFCVNKYNTMIAEFDREQTLLENDKKSKVMSDDQYETLMLSCSALAGGISELRAVLEWARKFVEAEARTSI